MVTRNLYQALILSELFGFVLLLLRSLSRWALEPIYLSLGTGRGQSADTYLEFNFELVKNKKKTKGELGGSVW